MSERGTFPHSRTLLDVSQCRYLMRFRCPRPGRGIPWQSSVKPVAYNSSLLECRIGHVVPIWQPYIGPSSRSWVLQEHPACYAYFKRKVGGKIWRDVSSPPACRSCNTRRCCGGRTRTRHPPATHTAWAPPMRCCTACWRWTWRCAATHGSGRSHPTGAASSTRCGRPWAAQLAESIWTRLNRTRRRTWDRRDLGTARKWRENVTCTALFPDFDEHEPTIQQYEIGVCL
jgi:hypothetical protein